MKERVLTAVELKILLKDLNQIVKSKVNKIYQPNSKQLIFKLYKKELGEILLKIESGKALYITKFKESYPERPTSFCMYLRKLLNNKFITNLTQKNFERIVEIHFDKYILILELFSQGNFILTDKNYKIQNLAHARTWASRVLKKGEIYKYPPASLKPEQIKKFEKEVSQKTKRLSESKKSLNEELDLYYSKEFKRKIESKGLEKYNSQFKKLNKILEKQKLALENYENQYSESKQKGDLIYEYYKKVQDALKKEKTKFKFKNIELDPKLSLAKNAAKYYEKAKKLKVKISGAKKTLQKTSKDISDLEKQKAKIIKQIEESKPVEIKKKVKKWYQKFRWFKTSSGLLAVGGRDATSNDILIKKHMEPSDLVFHTQTPGSPFFLLKLKKNQKPSESDINEVAIATASYSRAWSSGLASSDVFYVKPNQVSKTPPSGEYLKKGSFMIYGKKTFIRGAPLEISIGIDKNKELYGGPTYAIKKHASFYRKIRPGSNKKSDIAKKLMAEFKLKKSDLPEIERLLPPGKSSIKD